MAHLRIRPFNTKVTYPEQRLDNDLSQAVVARGTFIFLRGQTPQDLDTMPVSIAWEAIYSLTVSALVDDMPILNISPVKADILSTSLPVHLS